MKGAIAALAGTALALLVPAGAAATPISHTFEADNEGWFSNQGSGMMPADYLDTGGNPDGHLSEVDSEADPANELRFLRLFPPDLSANYGGTWFLDLNSDMAIDYQAQVRIYRNTTFDFVFRNVVVPSTGWQSLSVPLTEEGWSYCVNESTCGSPTPQATFQGILADANFLYVRVDVHIGTGETYGLDNVILTDGPTSPGAGAPATPGETTPTGKKCRKGFKLKTVRTKKGKKRKRCVRKRGKKKK